MSMTPASNLKARGVKETVVKLLAEGQSKFSDFAD